MDIIIFNKRGFLANVFIESNIPFDLYKIPENIIDEIYQAFYRTDRNIFNTYANYLSDNVKESYTIFIKSYLIAINQGYHVAAMNLTIYYRDIHKDDLSLKYLLISMEMGHIDSFNMLGLYYKDKQDFNLMKKYFELGITKNDSACMANLAEYYLNVEKNNDNLVIKYCLMAIKLNDDNSSNAMNNLAICYQLHGQYNLMKKYYYMAIDRDHVIAMANLASYYYHIEKDYDMAERYYLMAIKHESQTAIVNLAQFYSIHIKELNINHYLSILEKQPNNTFIMIMIAINYYDKDNLLSTKYFKMAILHGHSTAESLYMSLMI